MATQILRMNNDTDPLGNKWTQHSVQRNPRIASCIGRRIEASRIKGTQRETIQRFFDHFERVQSQHHIRSEHIWNTDETGNTLGVCTNTQVLAQSGKTRTYVKSPQNREWVSIIETVSATGSKLRPVVIFKGKAPQSTWFNSNTPAWIYATLENGWIANRITINWLQEVFLSEIKSLNQEARFFLWMAMVAMLLLHSCGYASRTTSSSYSFHPIRLTFYNLSIYLASQL